MSMKMAIQIEQLQKKVQELEELVHAICGDIVELQEGGSLVSEPGLRIPKFPRVLQELGLLPPEEEANRRASG